MFKDFFYYLVPTECIKQKSYQHFSIITSGNFTIIQRVARQSGTTIYGYQGTTIYEYIMKYELQIKKNKYRVTDFLLKMVFRSL